MEGHGSKNISAGPGWGVARTASASLKALPKECAGASSVTFPRHRHAGRDTPARVELRKGASARRLDPHSDGERLAM